MYYGARAVSLCKINNHTYDNCPIACSDGYTQLNSTQLLKWLLNSGCSDLYNISEKKKMAMK